MVLEGVQELLAGWGVELSPAIPEHYLVLMTILVYSVLLTIYALFIWFFCKNLSKRDLMTLNLQQYNESDHPFFNKLFAFVLYVVEYIVILPFFVLIWFSVLALIIAVLSPEQQTIQQALILSAAIVTATRIVAYYKEALAQEIAKLFPLTILAISVTTPGFFSLTRIANAFGNVQELASSLWLFFIFIIVVELVLRLLQFAQDSFFPDSTIISSR